MDDELFVDDRGREGEVGEGEFDVCDRLTFFVGGGCGVFVVVGEALVVIEGR